MNPAEMGPMQLPPELAVEIHSLRRQWAELLQFAARGARGRDRELRALQRQLGALLAREAQRPLERRGVRMVSLALSVNAAFPELRSFEARERRRREQMAAARVLSRQIRRPA